MIRNVILGFCVAALAFCFMGCNEQLRKDSNNHRPEVKRKARAHPVSVGHKEHGRLEHRRPEVRNLVVPHRPPVVRPPVVRPPMRMTVPVNPRPQVERPRVEGPQKMNREELIKKFDKDKDGKLNEEEKTALQKFLQIKKA